MAAIAAFRMFSGVGKSGSPALKSTTSTPSRRSLSASAITFMVEETLMSEMRSAVLGACRVGVIVLELTRCFKSFAQALFHEGWDEACNVSAEADDYLDQSGTDEGKGFAGEEESGFESGLQAAIHEGHLQFVFVVGDGADAAEDHAGVSLQGVVGEETVEGIDFDVFEGADSFGQHFHALLDGK